MDKLVTLGAEVIVIDNLSSGKLENLSLSKDKIKFVNKDLEYLQKDDIKELFKDQEKIFHLAAVHGGRGYITNHPADVCSNLAIDHHIFEAASNSSIENIVFASTACVYPTKLQHEIGSIYKLKEEDSNPLNLDGFLSADIEYGWGKLMSEIQMLAFQKQYGLKGCPVRFVTAYGPRENETHAIIALIYKAVERMDPYIIWGDGQQERDFTYVEDIVNGCLLASKQIKDCTPINLGTGERYKIIDVVNMIFKILGWKPMEIKTDLTKPVGALSRALDNDRANKLINWQPQFTLEEGLRRTIQWYIETHTKYGIVNEKKLLEH
ncbi:MAG: NAD-dependent epimerase/dehydratase family protein [Candidatus Nitrosocosmicus sp.]|nr:NAD-dependent epimerase/dehydratase family protein [Candidatus Nitrosocosmicus sp.]MDN5868032.1 NAD-dependent epimerase/dehydratase family protein [Candidatus Nitrosocosmicus sp.]